MLEHVYSLSPESNGLHFVYNIFKCISFNENVLLFYQLHYKKTLKSIDNMSAMALLMAWHQTCDKPLSEHLVIQFIDICMHQNEGPPQCIILSYCYTGISIIKLRWSHDCLIFIMGILIPGKMTFALKWDLGLSVSTLPMQDTFNNLDKYYSCWWSSFLKTATSAVTILTM